MTDQADILDAAPKGESELISAVHSTEREIAAMEKLEAGFTAIEKAHPANLALDVSTPQGMKDAIAARRAYREPRVEVEKVRKAAKAPVIALGKQIDAYAAKLTDRLLLGESNYDEQIKAHEEKVAREKTEAAEREAKRVQAIRDAIAINFTNVPRAAFGKSAEALLLVVQKLVELEPSEQDYAELLPDAKAAHGNALALVRDMHEKAVAAEAEAARLAEERRKQEEAAAELQRQREAFEREQKEARMLVEAQERERQAQQAQREAAEREQRRAEEERQRAEREKIEAERRALEEAKQRAEADRLAAIERKRLDEEAAAERERLAEEQRKADEAAAAARAAEAKKAAAEAAKSARAQAKLDAIHKAGPRLLEVLKLANWMLQRDPIDDQKAEVIAKCDALIEELEPGDAAD